MAQSEPSTAPRNPTTHANGAVGAPQDDQFMRKYGTLLPRRSLMRNESCRKRFDSGDWCLERLGLCSKDAVPLDVPVEQLAPKLHPEPSSQLLRRTHSVLRASEPLASSDVH